MNTRRIAKAMEIVRVENERIEANRLAVAAAHKAGAAARRGEVLSKVNTGLGTASTLLTITTTGYGLVSSVMAIRRANEMIAATVPQMSVQDRLAAQRNADAQDILSQTSATKAARKARKAAKRAEAAQEAWVAIEHRLAAMDSAYKDAMDTSGSVATIHSSIL